MNAVQTNIAIEQCSGDWCFYLQADEVVHEKYLPVIKDRCRELLNDQEVEGLVFDYRHFWGDYDHYQLSHGWYKREIRIIRNNIGINSYRSAQGLEEMAKKELRQRMPMQRYFIMVGLDLPVICRVKVRP